MTAAARKLRLAQPTLSAQIAQLEEMLGEPLFDRQGRRLELTVTGQTVYQYADEIFRLGQELLQAVHSHPSGMPRRFSVGISDTLPKLAVYHLMAPVLQLEGGVRLDLQEGQVPVLLSELGAHHLDVVLSDTPVPPGSGVRAYNHALGDCGVSFFAQAPMAATLAKDFPQSLDGIRMLMPGRGSALRRELEEWLGRLMIQPDIVGEIADSALLKVFGQGGAGVFAAPSVVAAEVARQYEVVAFGETEEVRERFWAISAERRIRHPAIQAIVMGARLFFKGPLQSG